MKNIIYILITLILSQSAIAENTLTTAAAAATPKWKTSFNSYYYQFDGTRESNRADYTFGDTNLKMQLMGLQYQLDNGWSLIATAQYYENTVDTRFLGTWYHDTSKGIADTFFTAVKPYMLTSSLMLMPDIGFSVPTGSIKIKNANDATRTLNYAYNMQMGSGTYDGIIGATAIYLQPDYQIGSRLGTIIRTGDKNSEGYRLGNQYRLDAWVDVPTKVGITPRVVGYYKYKDAIEGQDKTYGRNGFVEFYHHSQINWDVSAALKYAYSFTTTVALNAEAGIPMAQDSQNYDNVVVSTQYFVNLGVTGQF